MTEITADSPGLSADNDTIVAQATPPGRGGVAVVRVSGPLVPHIAQQLTHRKLTPRYAHYTNFYGSGEQASAATIDQGIALFFPAPHSFTGEDVLELQGHGGQVIIDLMIRHIIAAGARAARPGEFSERAFLNGKLDLAQAEAIADLIDSSSEQAARSAVRTLQGEFSRRIKQLVEALIELRVFVEAAIDFPEEEIDFLADGKVMEQLVAIITSVEETITAATQGAVLREGMKVVLAGPPNGGKSSLLNCLSGRSTAIVTAIPGTTRDLLHEQIVIDGMPLHITDTAGLRQSNNPIEQEGIRRAWEELQQADRILLIVDSSQTRQMDPQHLWPDIADRLRSLKNITVIQNKVDLSGLPVGIIPPEKGFPYPLLRISAKNGQGVALLKQHLKECMGYTNANEGSFIARRRHLDALQRALKLLQQGQAQLAQQAAGELLAEDLRIAQQALGEITGEFSSDDLLGRIFSSFCIGK